jgi:hypothetical protein
MSVNRISTPARQCGASGRSSSKRSGGQFLLQYHLTTQRPLSTGVPWYIWSCVIAITCSGVGIIWDISWHKSIGRDSFLTPPHVLVYLSGILAGLSCGYVILATTFGRDPVAREASVKMWGFRGPLGAFLCAWGGVAMIASAPFDNWWHNAYGLDVKILSPPHIVLTLGMIAIRFGTLLFILGQLNRASGRPKTILSGLLLYSFMSLMSISLGAFQELTVRPYMHSALFYLLVSATVPLWLATIGATSSSGWACTILAGLYTVYFISFIWILPLFPAEPKLGPVYHSVTRFVPPDFPLLLIAPAFAIDLLRRRFIGWPAWQQAIATGAVFLGVFVIAQWPFADFLQSASARNWVFGTQYFPYFIPSDSPYVRYVFVPFEHSAAEFWRRMVLALLAAAVMTRIGLAWGAGMRKLQR